MSDQPPLAPVRPMTLAELRAEAIPSAIVPLLADNQEAVAALVGGGDVAAFVASQKGNSMPTIGNDYEGNHGDLDALDLSKRPVARVFKFDNAADCCGVALLREADGRFTIYARQRPEVQFALFEGDAKTGRGAAVGLFRTVDGQTIWRVFGDQSVFAGVVLEPQQQALGRLRHWIGHARDGHCGGAPADNGPTNG